MSFPVRIDCIACAPTSWPLDQSGPIGAFLQSAARSSQVTPDSSLLASSDAQGDDGNRRCCDYCLRATRELPDQVAICMTRARRKSTMDVVSLLISLHFFTPSQLTHNRAQALIVPESAGTVQPAACHGRVAFLSSAASRRRNSINGGWPRHDGHGAMQSCAH